MKNKHYLVRTPMNPFKTVPYSELHAHIGTNVGNLVYVAGAVRALMLTDDSKFRIYRRRRKYTEEELDRFNHKYDGFIITLADALRNNYEPTLKQLTEFVRKLKIPCVVIGCGLRAPYEPDPDFSYPFDDSAREFFSAVLDHSAMIGLRGQITADYLKHLGFKEERDYTVIGCPSMYMWGRELPYKGNPGDLEDLRNAPCSFNLSPEVSQHAYSLIDGLAAEMKNAVYIPQNSADEILMYYGQPIEARGRIPEWPVNLDHPFFKRNKAMFFDNPVSWIDFQKTRSLSFGTRVHGNITAVLAGTPALFLPQTARPRELCEYHGFANIAPAELEKISSLKDAITKIDFEKPLKVHGRNFDHYMDFLKANGLESIFEHPEIEEIPYDKKVKEVFRNHPALRPVSKEPFWVKKRRQKEWEKFKPDDEQ